MEDIAISGIEFFLFLELEEFRNIETESTTNDHFIIGFVDLLSFSEFVNDILSLFFDLLILRLIAFHLVFLKYRVIVTIVINVMSFVLVVMLILVGVSYIDELR